MTAPSAHDYIDDPRHLEDYAAALAGRAAVALDTEFLRERTYYPRLCLLQLASDEGTSLVDPLALDSLEPLLATLYQPRPLKIFHAAGQDLEIFVQLNGGVPPALFDTQVAAAHLGFPDQIGYAGLVEQVLGISLDKTHTRSDWSRRPLSTAQLGYAVEDVCHLWALYPVLRRRLEERGRLAWALEDMARLEDPARYRVDPATAWRRLKGVQRLPGKALAVARVLARWREEQAQRRDLPRGWVLANNALMELAHRRPQSLTELQVIDGIGEGTVKRYGAALLEMVAGAAGEQDSPGELPLTDDQKRLLKVLSARVAERAEALGVSSTLLATRAELEALARGRDGSQVLEGWRREVVGEELLALRGG